MIGITVFQYITFSVSLFYIFVAFIQLNYRNKLALNYFMFGLFFAASYVFLYYWAYSTRILKAFPLLVNTDIAVGFLVGPFLFFYYSEIIGAKRNNILYILLCIIPFIISLLAVTYFNIANPDIYLESIDNSIFPGFQQNKGLFILNLLSDISMAIYFLFTLIRISKFIKPKKINFEFKIVLIILLLFFINGMLILVANMLHNNQLFLIGLMIYSIVPIYYAFFSFRNPEFAVKVIKEAKSIRYKRSIVKKHDDALIGNRLLQLMGRRKNIS